MDAAGLALEGGEHQRRLAAAAARVRVGAVLAVLAVLEQGEGDVVVPIAGGQDQGREALAIARVRVRPGLEQHPRVLDTARAHRPRECDLSIGAAHAHAPVGAQQRLEDRAVRLSSSPDHGRLAVVRARVHVGTRLEQQPRDLVVTVGGRDHQGRDPGSVHAVRLAAALQQPVDDLGGALLGRSEQRRLAASGAQIRSGARVEELDHDWPVPRARRLHQRRLTALALPVDVDALLDQRLYDLELAASRRTHQRVGAGLDLGEHQLRVGERRIGTRVLEHLDHLVVALACRPSQRGLASSVDRVDRGSARDQSLHCVSSAAAGGVHQSRRAFHALSVHVGAVVHEHRDQVGLALARLAQVVLPVGLPLFRGLRAPRPDPDLDLAEDVGEVLVTRLHGQLARRVARSILERRGGPGRDQGTRGVDPAL